MQIFVEQIYYFGIEKVQLLERCLCRESAGLAKMSLGSETNSYQDDDAERGFVW